MAKINTKTNIFTLKSPRITEKSSMLQERNVYVFNVQVSASKKDVEKAVKAQYKVTPVRINMVKVPAKTVTVRNKIGRTNLGKKAYVFLKKGDTLKLV
ncbi:MAG: 50S ribosomal protein L23 [Minisyncoccia bacterium]